MWKTNDFGVKIKILLSFVGFYPKSLKETFQNQFFDLYTPAGILKKDNVLETEVSVVKKNFSIRNFPIALFSSVMGFAALTIAMRHLENTLHFRAVGSTILMIGTTVIFLLNALFLFARLVGNFAGVQEDFKHPVQRNFLGTISISFLLLSALYVPHASRLAFVLWGIGALFQITLTLIVLTKMMFKKNFEKTHLTPVTFIPVVGNLVVPIAGVHFVGEWINIFFFSIGIFFSIVLMTLMFERMFFSEPLPDMLFPTIFIFLAPPSVSFIALSTIEGALNLFGMILYSIAFFMFLILCGQVKNIFQLPFFISFWSLLFPLGAFTVATVQLYQITAKLFFGIFSGGLLIVLILLSLYLVWRTIRFFQA